MCTCTWAFDEGGLNVMFNRDEQHGRPEGLPPRVIEGIGLPVLAPLDPAGGGSWIAASGSGRIVALLNHYDCAVPELPAGRSWRSRGKLVIESAKVRKVSEFLGLEIERSAYQPFRLLVFEVGPSVEEWLWNGETLERCPEALGSMGFRTSSSVRPEEVMSWRHDQFLEVRADGYGVGARRDFHLLKHETDDAMSVLMRRDDARTVSLTEVTIRDGWAAMEVTPVDREGVLGSSMRQIITSHSKEGRN